MLKNNQHFTASKLTKLEHNSVSWPEPHKTLQCSKKINFFTALKLTKHCNTQKIPKFSGICPRPGHRCQNFGIFCIFWALQRFVSSEVGNLGFFWAWQCFVRLMSQEPRKRRFSGVCCTVHTVQYFKHLQASGRTLQESRCVWVCVSFVSKPVQSSKHQWPHFYLTKYLGTRSWNPQTKPSD